MPFGVYCSHRPGFIIMTEKENKTDAFLGDVFNYILSKYKPAISAEDATVKLTTADIFTQLQQLCPSSAYDAEDVYYMMDSSGFKYHSQGNDLSFVWLMKPRS